LVFTHGVDTLLALNPDSKICLTKESAGLFAEAGRQAELVEAARDKVAAYAKSFSRGEKTAGADRRREMVDFATVIGDLQALRMAIEYVHYNPEKLSGDEYTLLYNCESAVQILLKIVIFLESKGFATASDRRKTNRPHIVLLNNESNALRELILQIADVLGCREKMKDFLQDLKDKGIKPSLLLYDHRDTDYDETYINSASIVPEV